jgi:hypothetical protein
VGDAGQIQAVFAADITLLEENVLTSSTDSKSLELVPL